MKNVSKSTVLVSVDGSKESHHVILKRWGGSGVKPFVISNDRRGFDLLSKRIKLFQGEGECVSLAFAYEPTGPYLLPLVHHMKAKGARIIQINPKHVKRLKELPDNSPGKTDKKDPGVIAFVAERNAGMTAVLPKGIYAEMRQLVQVREQLVTDQTRCLNRIEATVAEFFPEYLQIMKGMKGETSRYLMRHYSTPQQIVDLGLTELTNEMRQVSKSRLTTDRATALFEAAQSSIGVTEGTSGMIHRIHCQLDMFDLIAKQMKDVTAKIIELCQDVPYAQFIESIQGFGWMTTAYLLSEIGGMGNYRKSRQVEKLAGLNLYEISSGKHFGIKRITKRGRELMRKILFLAAVRMVKKNGIFYEAYQDLLKRGKRKTLALVNISKKILRLAFALARDRVFFDATKQGSQTIIVTT